MRRIEGRRRLDALDGGGDVDLLGLTSHGGDGVSSASGP
jgi:hypothetical protein